MVKQLSQDVRYMPVPVDKQASKPRVRAAPEAKTALERARRGHCMCGDNCDICKMAKFRAGKANKHVGGIFFKIIP